MQQHLKDFGKYAASAALSLVLVLLVGAVTSLTVLLMGGFEILTKDRVIGGHADAGLALFFVALLHPICSVILLVAGIILPIVYFGVGYKTVLKKVIYKVLHEKGESIIYPLLDKLLNEFRQKQPSSVKTTTDYSLKKLQLMESIKQGQGNGLLRRVVAFGLSKVKLNDVELNKEGRDFYEVIKIATVQQLKQVSKPSWWPLLIILILQWLGLYAIKLLPV